VLSLTGHSAEEVEGRGLVRFDPLPSVCSKDGGTTYTKKNFNIVDIDIDIDSIFPKIRTRQCHVKLFESFSTVR
jgi:hypothetical protein